MKKYIISYILSHIYIIFLTKKLFALFFNIIFFILMKNNKKTIHV